MAWFDLPTWRRAKRKDLLELIALLLFFSLLAGWLMRNWLLPFLLPTRFGPGLPTSARREVLTELSIVWMFRQELMQGHMLSEWNPYWFSGFPWLRFLAYPLYYLVAGLSLWGKLSIETALVVFYFVVLAGSGLAMYGFLRRISGGRLAALLGAVIYVASPYHNHVGAETWIHAAFWVVMPLALWGIDWALAQNLSTRARISRLLVAGLALGLFPIISSEYALIAGPFVVLYLLLHQAHALTQHTKSWREAVADVALVGLMAAGIAFFIVLPGLVETRLVGIHAKHAGGTTFSDELLRDYAVTPKLVLYAIMQRMPLPQSVKAWIDIARLPRIVHSFWSVAWYPGLLAAGLALIGLTRFKRHLAVTLAAVGLILSALFIMGPTFLLNPFQYLPVIGRFSPFRGMLLIVTFMAMLAAFGATFLLNTLRGSPLFGRLRSSSANMQRLVALAMTALVIVLVLVDFAPSSGAYQVTTSYFDDDDLAAYDWLAQNEAEGRLWEPIELPRDQYLRTVSFQHSARARYVGYYDNGAPLHTWQQIAWTDPATALSLHQVRFVLLDAQDSAYPGLSAELAQAGYQQSFAAGDAQVWENADNGQYARLYAHSALDAADDFFYSFHALPTLAARNIAMVAEDPDTRQTWDDYDYILLTTAEREGLRHAPDGPAPLLHRMIDATRIDHLAVAPESDAWLWPERLSWEDIHVDVQTWDRGVLTIAESWYPHWQVYVNGERAPVRRVNWALLGVELEPGTHRVRFHFQRPWYVYIAISVSALTLLCALFWWTRHLALRLNIPRPTASVEYLRHLPPNKMDL